LRDVRKILRARLSDRNDEVGYCLGCMASTQGVANYACNVLQKDNCVMGSIVINKQALIYPRIFYIQSSYLCPSYKTPLSSGFAGYFLQLNGRLKLNLGNIQDNNSNVLTL